MTAQEALRYIKYATSLKLDFNGQGQIVGDDTIEELRQVIISALEKQIQKRPLPERDLRSGRIVSFTCPNCNHTDLGNCEYRFECCEVCGQALDWSDS